jgi:hypothetical protein
MLNISLSLTDRTAMIKLKVIRMFNIARVERAVQKIRESNTHTAHRQRRSRGSKHVVDMCIYIVFLALFIVIYLTPDSDQDNFLLGNAVSIQHHEVHTYPACPP